MVQTVNSIAESKVSLLSEIGNKFREVLFLHGIRHHCQSLFTSPVKVYEAGYKCISTEIVLQNPTMALALSEGDSSGGKIDVLESGCFISGYRELHLV